MYDKPPDPEAAAWGPWPRMHKACIDRHNGSVVVVYGDTHTETVGLKELWTLKWHRQFDVAGLWTTAGGVQPEDWPEWMQDFKDY